MVMTLGTDAGMVAVLDRESVSGNHVIAAASGCG